MPRKDSFGSGSTASLSRGLARQYLRDLVKDKSKTEKKAVSVYETGASAFHLAVNNNDIETLSVLLKTKKDATELNIQTEDGATALMIATMLSRESMVEALLAGGADPSLPDLRGRSPMYIATARGMVNIVRLFIISKDFNIDSVVGPRGVTSLHMACLRGHYDIVTLLLDFGADINCTTDSKATALHCAVLQKDERIIQLLLQRGINPCLMSVNGRLASDLEPSPALLTLINQHKTNNSEYQALLQRQLRGALNGEFDFIRSIEELNHGILDRLVVPVKGSNPLTQESCAALQNFQTILTKFISVRRVLLERLLPLVASWDNTALEKFVAIFEAQLKANAFETSARIYVGGMYEAMTLLEHHPMCEYDELLGRSSVSESSPKLIDMFLTALRGTRVYINLFADIKSISLSTANFSTTSSGIVALDVFSQKLQEIQVRVDEAVVAARNEFSCRLVADMLGGDFEPFISPNRFLVKQGALDKIPMKHSSRKQTRYFFLFSDMLLFCGLKSKQGLYEVKGRVDLASATVSDVTDASKSSFQLTSTRGEWKLTAGSEDEKRSWLTALSKATDARARAGASSSSLIKERSRANSRFASGSKFEDDMTDHDSEGGEEDEGGTDESRREVDDKEAVIARLQAEKEEAQRMIAHLLAEKREMEEMQLAAAHAARSSMMISSSPVAARASPALTFESASPGNSKALTFAPSGGGPPSSSAGSTSSPGPSGSSPSGPPPPATSASKPGGSGPVRMVGGRIVTPGSPILRFGDATPTAESGPQRRPSRKSSKLAMGAAGGGPDNDEEFTSDSNDETLEDGLWPIDSGGDGGGGGGGGGGVGGEGGGQGSSGVGAGPSGSNDDGSGGGRRDAEGGLPPSTSSSTTTTTSSSSSSSSTPPPSTALPSSTSAVVSKAPLSTGEPIVPPRPKSSSIVGGSSAAPSPAFVSGGGSSSVPAPTTTPGSPSPTSSPSNPTPPEPSTTPSVPPRPNFGASGASTPAAGAGGGGGGVVGGVGGGGGGGGAPAPVVPNRPVSSPAAPRTSAAVTTGGGGGSGGGEGGSGSEVVVVDARALERLKEEEDLRLALEEEERRAQAEEAERAAAEELAYREAEEWAKAERAAYLKEKEEKEREAATARAEAEQRAAEERERAAAAERQRAALEADAREERRRLKEPLKRRIMIVLKQLSEDIRVSTSWLSNDVAELREQILAIAASVKRLQEDLSTDTLTEPARLFLLCGKDVLAAPTDGSLRAAFKNEGVMLGNSIRAAFAVWDES